MDLEDVKFHQCVRLARFDADRTISFTPPNQSLATYRLTYTIQDANLRRSTAAITSSTEKPRP